MCKNPTSPRTPAKVHTEEAKVIITQATQGQAHFVARTETQPHPPLGSLGRRQLGLVQAEEWGS